MGGRGVLEAKKTPKIYFQRQRRALQLVYNKTISHNSLKSGGIADMICDKTLKTFSLNARKVENDSKMETFRTSRTKIINRNGIA